MGTIEDHNGVEGVDRNDSLPEKQALLRRLLNVGVAPEIVGNYYEILSQFFAGKLAKYQLEEKLKSLLPPQAIKAHNETFVQVLQQAQQGGNTPVPSLTTHEKDSKYVKRRLLVKRPIKSITSWNETQEPYPSTENKTSATLNRKRKRIATRNKAEASIASQAKKKDSQPVGSNNNNTSDHIASTTKPSLDRKGDDVAWNSQGDMNNTRQAVVSPSLPTQWKDAIIQHSVYRVGKRMKQIAAENEIYQIDKDAMVGLFHALEFHLLDIIKGTREETNFKQSNKYRQCSLSIRDLYRFTEYAQDVLGDPYSMDRTCLAFSIF
ncbi:hypothetical protein GpartN1_g7089.t1 [Galdieria partita]|uniref:Uncharacterized protein n=1 Tax=Galdieria partita TaxID=83374 RepID=A0A9C7Q2I5_9RHOD|nr:hypothetical protein GpartN1_g7089.t1 [Galdieria partita]